MTETTPTPKAHKESSVESKASEPKTKTTKTESQPVNAQKSVTGVIAIVLSLVAIGGSAGSYWWHQQQQKQWGETIAQLQQAQQQTQSALVTSNTEWHKQQQQINELFNQQQQTWHQNLQALEQKVNELTQVDESQWQLHQIQYQLQMAQRALILERTPKSSIMLLQQVQQQLTQLGDNQYLALAKAVNQDITKLSLLPKLNTDQTLLTLSSLMDEVSSLKFAQVEVPAKVNAEPEQQVSESINDFWQNLAIVWHNFSKDFLTVSRRQGNVEPLMTPELQQNLRANIINQLQLAQWAASNQRTKVYHTSLAKAGNWLKQYFDQQDLTTQNFEQQIEQLKQATIKLNMPKQLQAIEVFKQLKLAKEKKVEVATTAEHPAKENSVVEVKEQSAQGDKL